ncbi:MAG: META domain-containing protein [Alistipes sp.]
MKKWIFTALCALTFVWIAGGCCKCRTYQQRTQKPLMGTAWQLVQLKGQTITPSEETYTLLFGEDGRLSGKGACNRIMAAYQVGEKCALTISSAATTRMACPGMEQEAAFIQALEGITHYEMDGPMLMLLAHGELYAVLQSK